MLIHPMSRRATVSLAWIGFLVLVVLHVDSWRPQRSEVYLGWIPEELLYRFIWIGLAWLYLLFICARVWEDDGDEERE